MTAQEEKFRTPFPLSKVRKWIAPGVSGLDGVPRR